MIRNELNRKEMIRSVYIFSLIILLLPFVTASGNWPAEKVFFHTDRDIYVAGEDVLYSFYLVDQEQRSSEKRSVIGYLEIINQNNTSVAQARFEIVDGCSSGVLSIPDSLSSGKYLLRGYTRYLRNFGPDHFYLKHITIYNPFKENIKLNPAETKGEETRVKTGDPLPGNIQAVSAIKDEFQAREKVTIRLQLDSSSFSSPGNCNISIGVSVPGAGGLAHNISEQQAGLTGDRFDDDHTNTADSFRIFPEITGPFLEGTVVSRQSLEADGGRILVLSIPGNNTYFRYSYTDDNGVFRFSMPPYRGNKEFIIQPSDFSNDILIKTSSAYAEAYDYFTGIECGWNKELLDLASQLAVNYQVNKIYGIDNVSPEPAQATDSFFSSFYGEPDVQVLLDNYIDLPTMEEIFHELVPGVVLRRQGGSTGFVFTGEFGGSKGYAPEAVFLDGVLIDDPAFIAGVDPDMISRIDVIRGEYQSGNMVMKGIISIYSAEGDMLDIDYPDSGLRTAGRVLDIKNEYRNHEYSDSLATDSRIPDFRNTLYWDPAVKPDDKGIIEFTFYTSDFLSDYRISVQGITDLNEFINYSKAISVIK